jgi:hypothetical protein
VIGLRVNGSTIANPVATTELVEGSELVMLGTPEQRHTFLELPPVS